MLDVVLLSRWTKCWTFCWTFSASKTVGFFRPSDLQTVEPECLTADAEAAHCALAVPTGHRAQLVKDVPPSSILRPLGRLVVLRHRRHQLAARAHAESLPIHQIWLYLSGK